MRNSEMISTLDCKPRGRGRQISTRGASLVPSSVVKRMLLMGRPGSEGEDNECLLWLGLGERTVPVEVF